MIVTGKAENFKGYMDEETYEKIVRYPSLTAMWAHCATAYADLPAIEDGGKSYTYAQLDEDVARMRGVLAAAGVAKGVRVGVYMRSSYDYVKVFLAVTTLGGVATLLPAQLPEQAAFGCSMKYAFKHLVYDASTAEKIALCKNAGVTTIDAGCDLSAAEKTPAATLSPADDCCILFTGGTTGKSKGALLSHGAVQTGVRNGCYGYKNVFFQRYFLVLPLTHVFGLVRNFLTSLYTGSVLYVCREPKNMFKETAAFKPTMMILVPALAELALNITKQFGFGLLGGQLKTIVCGASAVSPYLVEKYNELGVALLPGYGLTETANLVSGNPEYLKKPSSVGLPFPDQELKVVDGELWVRGDHMMTRYIGEDEAQSAAFEEGWFKTGDLVRFDEDGYLYIVGRIKEVIVLETGEKVSPAELEAAFLELDALSDCMVYEDFTESGRQILTLEVVPRAGFVKDEASVAAIKADLAAINAKLMPHERVSNIIVRDKDFDRTPAMKKIRIQKSR